MIFRRRRPPALEPAGPIPPAERSAATDVVPLSLQSVAAVAWRVLLVGAAIYVLVRLLRMVWVPFLALAAALFLAALLQRYAEFLRERLRFGRGLAAISSVLTLMVVVAALGYFVETRFAGSLTTLGNDLRRAGDDFVRWLHNGPLNLSSKQIDRYQDQLVSTMKKQQGHLTSIGVAGLSSVAELLTGALIALFTCFFLLYDGARMWSWVRGLFPQRARSAVDVAGHAAWGALTGYVRGTVIVAGIDAVCIGLGLVILQVPLAVPLAVIIFVGAFVPLVGAITTGIIAVLVALVTKGWVVALIALAILVAVQQIEGHLLQPLVLGRSVRLHPVAIIFAVAIGTTLAGIGGAVLSVPIMAVLNASIGALYRARRGADPEPEPEPMPPTGEPSGI
ncbi:MAG TPA: AI-2E family transporter [Mycobacteriales bacterium]|jgi:predicted PurR-regulated permease PerM|nr:AI-2E family transporter [Mycobacteriales bacterium]